MTVYSMILTNTGLSKIANAISTGAQINLSQIAVGDSNGAYYEPSSSQITLINEVHRFSINNKNVDSQNNSKIIIEGIIPASIGDFSIREIGIFDNTGVLIAVGKFPLIEKPNPSDDSAVDLYIKEYLVVSNSSAFNLTVDANIVTASINHVENEIADHNNDAVAHQDRWLLRTEVVTTPTANKVLELNSSSKLPASITGNADGNSETATKLQTARIISLTGDITGSVSFDGSADVSITSDLSASGVTAGSYKSVTVNTEGRVTAGTNPTTLSGYGITDAVSSSAIVTTPTADKILKLNSSSKLPASITGDADTVDGCHAGNAANNILKLDSGGKVPVSNLPLFDTVPAGSIFLFAKNVAPTGYLKCNGAAVSRTTYSALFSEIGITFGAGNGSTTFNLPNIRGEFVRGWDDSRGIDAGRILGSTQLDAFQGHWHDFWAHSSAQSGSDTQCLRPQVVTKQTAGFVKDPIADATNGTPRTASETRPRNIALLYCIKY